VTVPKYGPGYYFGTLNASDSSRYLWGGLNYSMTGDGGSAVGSFTVAETLNSTAALGSMEWWQSKPAERILHHRWPLIRRPS
jgi:hypothetical protein